MDITDLMREHIQSLWPLWNKRPAANIVIEEVTSADLLYTDGSSKDSVFKILFSCNGHVTTAYVYRPGMWWLTIKDDGVTKALKAWELKLREKI